MGVVYSAQDTNFKASRMVAVKEMRNQVSDSEVRKKIFINYERESNILASLRHPSIPRIYDYFTKNERAYLVMELIVGENLDIILSRTTSFFSESQIISWALELCDVISYLHSHSPEPIVFRDIKPTNIILTNQNHLMLVDFGIAKIFESGTKNTMVGTQGYAPPDQYRGEATPAVDIYGLGATFHHLLTLKDPKLEPPFSFSERPIETINPAVSPELVSVINKSLEYSPEDRYKSVNEMKNAIFGAAKKTGNLSQSTFSLPKSSVETSNIKPIWHFECEDEIRGTPLYNNGSIYIGSYDNNLYALDATNGAFKWKYATDGGIPGHPAVYEGTLFVGSEDSRLHAISTRSGSVNWTYYADGPIRSSPRIAEGHIFVGSDDGFLNAIQTNTGRLSWKIDANGPIRSTPFITNDSIYFGTETGDFLCTDFRGSVRWRFRAKKAITSSSVVFNNVVYFASLDSTLYALDATTGWVLWKFRFGKGSISSPVISDNKLFVGSADKHMYCLEISTSKEIWKFETQHQVNSTPLAFNDKLYFSSIDGFLYCLNQKNGKLNWKFGTEKPITGSPIAFGESIYFGSTNNILYALLP
jgi:eukaryotic-like serine/threonine-protein kinase